MKRRREACRRDLDAPSRFPQRTSQVSASSPRLALLTSPLNSALLALLTPDYLPSQCTPKGTQAGKAFNNFLGKTGKLNVRVRGCFIWRMSPPSSAERTNESPRQSGRLRGKKGGLIYSHRSAAVRLFFSSLLSSLLRERRARWCFCTGTPY